MAFSITTLRITTLKLMTFSITTLRITTLNTTTFSITILKTTVLIIALFSISTLGITTLSIASAIYPMALNTECCYVEYRLCCAANKPSMVGAVKV